MQKHKTSTRYENFAAQAWLTDSALVMKCSQLTSILEVSNHSQLHLHGLGGKGKDHDLQRMKLQDKAVTSADYNKALKMAKEQAESNKSTRRS